MPEVQAARIALGAPPPAHWDATGPWWETAALPRWWARRNDELLEARHRHLPIADVRVSARADEPERLLLMLCDVAERAALLRRRDVRRESA